MTPADEDALIDRVYADWIAGCDSGAKPVSELVRLAIRAAVAAERERAARVCEMVAGQYTSNPFGSVAKNCAAAIRKGE